MGILFHVHGYIHTCIYLFFSKKKSMIKVVVVVVVATILIGIL